MFRFHLNQFSNKGGLVIRFSFIKLSDAEICGKSKILGSPIPIHGYPENSRYGNEKFQNSNFSRNSLFYENEFLGNQDFFVNRQIFRINETK